ncbi:MAG: hypothetical protein KBG85_12355 [Micropruina sp.]|nr:hypothetical protein [Micropruina sp.]
MSTFTEMFTGTDDRARVLTEILSRGPAVPGTTLVAHVDRATLAVLEVRSLPTQPAVFDKDGYFDDTSIYELSRVLCAVATDCVPERTWDGERNGPITGELITVVCRHGHATITPTETQYFFGWRFSNHLTAALHGDVFVVTPVGWANILGDWQGTSPSLAVGFGRRRSRSVSVPRDGAT